MKRLASLCLVLALAACASTPLLDQETLAMRSVTSARQLSTAGLRAGKISLAADQKNQAVLTGMASAIKAAVAANDPATVATQQAQADKLAATLKGQ